MMRLYGAFEKVEQLEDGTLRVHGIATTEATDDQGEIVRASAMRAAIPDYMKFPAVREMHQLSAAGTTLEADVGDDNITRIVAHVIDPVAVSKVRNRVYRGFSIGGRVTQRESGNPKTITGLMLNEISLVDRPANPESVYEFWKASESFNPPVQIWACGHDDHRHLAKSDALKCQETQKTAQGIIDVPAEDITATIFTSEKTHADLELPTVVKAEDPKKPYGNVTYADTGFQDDKKKRYPIDTEGHIRAAWNYINKPNNAGQYSSGDLASVKARIVSAWKSKIDKNGPPSDKATMAESLRKAMWNIGQLAMLCHQLEEYCQSLAIERAVEGDGSDQPEKLHAIIEQLAGFLRDQVAEDTAEMLAGADADEEDMLAECWAPVGMMLKVLSNIEGSEKLVSEIEKRNMRHNRADQALLDTSAYAVNRALEVRTAKRGDLVSMADARKAVLDAGACDLGADGREMVTNEPPKGGSPTQNSTVDSGGGGATPVPQVGIGGGTHITMVKAAGFDAIDAIEKAGGGHVALMNAAHDLLCSVSDGIACKDTEQPSRHSAADTAAMVKAHEHMTKVDGVKCAATEEADPEATEKAVSETAEKAASEIAEKAASEAAEKVAVENDALAKTFETVLAKYAVPQPDPLIKTLADAMAALTAQVGTIAADVTKIKDTPLPPVTIARVPASVGKSADGGPQFAEGMTNDQLLQAMQKLSKEEQTLLLIKAAPAMTVRGITDAPGPVGSRQ